MRPLAGLTPRNLMRETLGGVTLLAIAVPLNIGYSQIAGLPPSAGLYALILPAVVYALMASSRQVIASPDAAAAALVASSVGGLAVAGSAGFVSLVLAQAIICGVLLLIAAVFRLGFLANFLSKPILIGFVGGLALDILVSQIAKMLGVRVDSGGEFVGKLVDLCAGLATANSWSLLISVVAIIVLVGGRRIAGVVPWALVVLVGATLVVAVTGLDQAGVAVLGHVDGGPPVLTWPILPWTAWLGLVPSAVALALVVMAEGLLVSRSYAEKRGYATNANRDLIAFGAANVAAGATGGFAVGASASRTAALDQAGVRTQLPMIVAAVGTLALLLFGTSLLAAIPSPAIGAIVGVAVLPLLGAAEFRDLWRRDRFEFAVGVSCFLSTLLIGAIPGILIAFVLALTNLARRAATPAIDVLRADDSPSASLLAVAAHGSMTAPGILVVRIAAPLFFANATVFSDAVKRAVARVSDSLRQVVIDLEAVTDIDVTGADSLRALTEWLSARGVEVSFSRGRPELLNRMQRLGLMSRERVYDTNRAAIAALSTQGD